MKIKKFKVGDAVVISNPGHSLNGRKGTIAPPYPSTRAMGYIDVRIDGFNYRDLSSIGIVDSHYLNTSVLKLDTMAYIKNRKVSK